MAISSREYDRLTGLQIKWGMSQEDMFYAIENGMLRTCIWLPLRYVERVIIQDRRLISDKNEHQEGFVGLRPEDCRRVCNTGCAKLRIFNSVCEDNHILRLAYEPPQPSISVRINDMVVLLKDRRNFEESYGIIENKQKVPTENRLNDFIASVDYRYVRLGGQEFHLGDIQARVIEQLHDAAQSHQPWMHGKTLLHGAGSNAIRLRDLFKNKNHWRILITSNERGYYRLNISMEGLEKNKTNKPEDTIQFNLAI